MFKINLKEKNAITLIALIITIIVLLILAGISLSLIMGEGGILTRATNARKANDIAGVKEKIELKAAEYSHDYLEKRYVNKELAENSKAGDFVASKIKEYATANSTLDNCNITYTENTKTITLTQNGYSETGTIQEDGSINWDGTPSGGSSSGAATVTVTSSTTTGTAVEYNIPYTDVYTGTAYTKDNGWLFLSKTEEGNGKYTVNLMSAGIPAKVYYHYTTNVPGGWWGTAEQVTNKYGATYANAGYDYNNSGYPNYFAATGLELNFESIEFAQGTTTVENGKGCYTSIGTNSGDVAGAVFKAGDNVSVHNMTYAEANSLGSNDARKVGAGSSKYWLATPFGTDCSFLYCVQIYGIITNSNGYDSPYGVRPVISISGVRLSE